MRFALSLAAAFFPLAASLRLRGESLRSAFSLAAGLGSLLGLCRGALGEDFRIETKVFAVKQSAPVSQNTTLFHAGKVYDYLADPPQTAVFDKAHGRFVILDPLRKLKTNISTSQVLVFCGELRAWSLNGTNDFLQFCGKPQFAIGYVNKTGELTLASEFMNYKLDTVKAKNFDAAHQMREFSDWYTRLNSLTNTGGLLPFARLAVNDQLDRRGLVAAQVELVIPPQGPLGGKGVNIRSEHDVKWQLLDRDLKRIADTNAELVNFKDVPFNVFMQSEQPAKKPEQQAKR